MRLQTRRVELVRGKIRRTFGGRPDPAESTSGSARRAMVKAWETACLARFVQRQDIQSGRWNERAAFEFALEL
jgi:hypothetical protein